MKGLSVFIKTSISLPLKDFISDLSTLHLKNIPSDLYFGTVLTVQLINDPYSFTSGKLSFFEIKIPVKNIPIRKAKNPEVSLNKKANAKNIKGIYIDKEISVRL